MAVNELEKVVKMDRNVRVRCTDLCRADVCTL